MTFRVEVAASTQQERPRLRPRPNSVNPRLRVWHERGIKEYVESSVWLAGRFIRISRRSSGI